MTFNFADDLLEAIAEKGSPVCVGLDPVYDRLPDVLRRDARDDEEQAEDYRDFCNTVLEVVAPHVPAVKIQSAYFELLGPSGVKLYYDLVDRARELDLMVIGDVKRNDIGSTAEAYAAAHLAGRFKEDVGKDNRPDAVTVNGYLGSEGIAPFLQTAVAEDKGVFVLVRTSNPSAREVQDFADAGGKKLFEHMAELVARLGSQEDMIGDKGYSCLGAVVGATYPDEARSLRQIMPQQIFLVPGYGAQGATAADCAAAFKSDGTGAIVNASRSVIFAYKDAKYSGMDWRLAIEAAAKAFAADIRQAVGL